METYKSSGVNKEEGYIAVEKIKKHVKKTLNNRVKNSIGGFASMYDLSGYKHPYLVSATDGVGTKLKIAIDKNKLDTIGIDCVAMCVNDLICLGAKPLVFLDYYATGALKSENLEQVVKGISEGCLISECSLVGGETAEMPGFYLNNDFDLAGFCSGVVEKDEIIDTNKINEKDVLIAIKSSGIHSNGFSLVRKVIKNYDTVFENKPIYKELLKPTKIYYKALKKLIKTKLLKGIAHITGGGLIENLPRIIPNGLCAEIETRKIKTPPIFNYIMNMGVAKEEMFETFNMGVGMVLVSDKKYVNEIINHINSIEDYYCYQIGYITKNNSKKICLK